MTLDLIFPAAVSTTGIALALWGLTRRRKTDPALTRSFLAGTVVLTLSGLIALRQVLLPDAMWLHWGLAVVMVPLVVFMFLNVRKVASRTSTDESSVQAFVQEIEQWNGSASEEDGAR